MRVVHIPLYPWEAFEHVDSDLGWHSLSSVDPFSGDNNAYSGSSAHRKLHRCIS